MLLKIGHTKIGGIDAVEIRDTDDVVRELRSLIAARELLWKAIDRKRSMRPSEKAMSKTAYARQIEALQIAINVFTGTIKLSPDEAKPERHAS